ncbi:aldehyde dehydrogenase family protein [Pyxidicoccus parkwayensis]|uniref:Aldehyde dehydrogenase family protein n=1 Tax=Pyxidicoccus parkwayensis TaxID=2813578 RepID=A0ABX7P2N1_9BACT|nr:aldehyde dehydrogenase family protein [Pyxidicoccus parkwaysis]QSQ24533.1 aldehyde dehydrogenase family protein [Pyxidicoccus parkwaysis]
MHGFDKLYIHGVWTPSRGGGHIDVFSASTEEVMGRIPEGTAEDVDLAVKAARAAFESWSMRPASERAHFLQRIHDGLTARQDDLARTITGEVGMPLGLAKPIQVGTPITVTASYVKLLQEFSFEEQVGNSLVVREPVGVVACITPWNYPLHQIIAKVVPALAAGCTVVLKPSEVAPLNAFLLAEVIHEAGVPAGVFNLVSGTGPVVGEALVRHPDVDMVSFTGSTRAGRRISEVAAATIKRVALELGGKSAAIVLDDANLKNVVKRVVGNCFLNSGQTCSAHTRMLVPRAMHEEAARLAAEVAASFTVGDPFKGEAKLGPLISDTQRRRVREYIQQGVREGAKLVAGGAEAPEGLAKGYYVKPTVFAGVTPEMTIAQEEIFGPVLVVMPYEDEDDAIRIANGTIYGLSGAVWSNDVERAKRVARRMRTGQVDINGGRFNPLAPFGGYRQSGHGREFGRYGLEEFLEHKAMQL